MTIFETLHMADASAAGSRIASVQQILILARCHSMSEAVLSQTSAGSLEAAMVVDSDAETAHSGNDLSEDIIEFQIQIAILIEDLEDMKIVAASWGVQLPGHRWVHELKIDIYNFVEEVTLAYSLLEEWAKFKTRDTTSIVDKAKADVEKFTEKYAQLKKAVVAMVDPQDTDDMDSQLVTSDEPPHKKHREAE